MNGKNEREKGRMEGTKKGTEEGRKYGRNHGRNQENKGGSDNRVELYIAAWCFLCYIGCVERNTSYLYPSLFSSRVCYRCDMILVSIPSLEIHKETHRFISQATQPVL